MVMNTILDGLPDDIKENIGECNSAKELWDKIKDLYSDEKSNETFQSEQSSVYNNTSNEDSFEKYSDIEAEVNMEVELESALDELRKYKQGCKQLKDQLKTVEKFKKGTETLDKVLSLQRFSSNKSGLGYDHTHIIKGSVLLLRLILKMTCLVMIPPKNLLILPRRCIKSKERTRPSIKVKTLHNLPIAIMLILNSPL
jgi:hypothetical protein